MRYPPIQEFERIWLRRLLLPILACFYAVAACVAIAHGVGIERLDVGLGRVVALAFEGHLAAVILLATQALAGDTVLQRLGWMRSNAPRCERILFAVVAGFVLSDAALMLLSMFDVLNSLTLASLVFAAVTVSLRFSSDPSLGLRSREPESASQDRFGRAWIWLAGVCAIVGALYWLWPLLVQTALPNSDWDSALYHLPLAERYLEGQLWNRDPLFSANSFPGGVSLVYAALIGAGFGNAVIPYNFLFVLLNLVAAYALGARLGNARTGLWAVLVCSGLHVLWQQGVDPRIDGFLALFVVTAMLGLVTWWRAPSEAAPLYLVAISLGAAIGAKYTGVFIALAFGGYIVARFVWCTVRRSAAPSPRVLAGFVVLLVLPNGAWYASNTLLHGDPLFPMLRGDYYEDPARPGERIAMVGALDDYIANLPEDAPERLRARALAGQFESAAPDNLFDLVDVYRRPEAYATKPNHFASPLLLLILSLPFVLPQNKERRATWLVLGSLSAVCFVGLASQTNLLRYTLPLLVLFAVGSALVIDRLRNRLWQAAWLVAGVAVLVSHLGPEQRKLERLRPELYVASDADPLTWLRGVGYNFTRAMPIVVDRINREIDAGRIAPDSRILMVGEGKGHLLRCDYLPDLTWYMQRWTVELLRANYRHDEIARSLRSQGVTHILYNPAYYRWVLMHTSSPIPPLAAAMEQLEAFLETNGRDVFALAGMRLVELEPAASVQRDRPPT